MRKTPIVIVALAAIACLGAPTDGQSRFSIDGSNIKLETAPTRTTIDDRQTGKKADSLLNRIFKDVRAGSCRASAAARAPSSTWPARGEAAVTVCRP